MKRICYSLFVSAAAGLTLMVLPVAAQESGGLVQGIEVTIDRFDLDDLSFEALFVEVELNSKSLGQGWVAVGGPTDLGVDTVMSRELLGLVEDGDSEFDLKLTITKGSGRSKEDVPKGESSGSLGGTLVIELTGSEGQGGEVPFDEEQRNVGWQLAIDNEGRVASSYNFTDPVSVVLRVKIEDDGTGTRGLVLRP